MYWESGGKLKRGIEAEEGEGWMLFGGTWWWILGPDGGYLVGLDGREKGEGTLIYVEGCEENGFDHDDGLSAKSEYDLGRVN